VQKSNVPNLYATAAEAEKHLLVAQTELQLVKLYPYLAIIRTMESQWSIGDGLYDEYARTKDARNLAVQMLHYNDVAAQVKALAGKVLTVLDAAFVNDKQNKAVKDLTKAGFREQLNSLWRKAIEDPNCESCEGMATPDILDA
jgi:hypothetical protein